MGSIFKSIGKIISAPFQVVKNLVDPQKAAAQNVEQTPQAQAAPQAAPQDTTQQTGVDTTGMTLKRKAKGKRSLMINPSNTGGGTDGTGLNI